MNKSDRLSVLKAFVRVVETRSFSQVARELGVPQPTVSRQVAALEKRLNVVLLVRTTRSVAPTEAGRLFYERLSDGLLRIEEAEAEARLGRQALRGVIRLTMPGAMGRHLLFSPLLEFAGRHPDVSLDLRVTDATLDLVSEAIDFAIRIGSPRDSSFAMRRLGESQQWFTASTDYLAARGTPTTMKDLVAHALIFRRAADGTMLVDDALRAAVVPRLIVDDVETAYAAVRAGVGITALPKWLVQAEVAAGTLVRILPRVPLPSAPIVALMPQGRHMTARARALLEHITEHFAAGA